jgi:fluoroquinolone transport system ATP-binding protein
VQLQEKRTARVGKLSGGQRQRVALACALTGGPELLFLDEPTTGQDPARARLTRELILRLKREGKTIFLTTHNMAEAAEICDRIGFLAGGRIPVTGTPQALKRQYGQRLLEVTTAGAAGLETTRFPVDEIGRNAAFLALIAGREVVAMHTLEASLDDVFILATAKAGGGEE